MSFLAPAFLIGLVALAVPIIIHLIQRERKRVVEFPSLMFLRRIPYQSMRRRRIRHWALLLVRLAALALVVAAFARPFVGRPGLDAAASAGGREVVILLDRSYSMGYGDRWDRARAAARRVVERLGADDRVTLILFSTGAELVLRSTTDRGQVIAAMASAGVSDGGTRYGPALKLAESVLAASKLPRREAVLVSDFQKLGWDRSNAACFPGDATLTPVPISDATTANVAITGVNLERTMFSGRERVTPTAAITRRGTGQAQDLDATLEIDGRAIAAQRVHLTPDGSASATFPPFTLAARHTRGTVRIGPDALPQDNAFHFVLSPVEPVPVLILERGGARDATIYLRSALAIGHAPRFEATVKPVGQVATTDFDRPAVVLINDAPLPTGPPGARLRRFVESGRGLLLVLGERSAWSADADWLPGASGPSIDRGTGRGAVLSAIDYAHPVFEIFKAPRAGDFSAARFFRYRAFTAAPSATVVARFDDGAAALVERPAGQGRVMAWTSTLDAFWNDLALKPVFLPFVHRVMTHLARYREPNAWLTVGQVLDLAADRVDRVAVAPGARQIPLPAQQPAAFELTERGFYDIRAQGAGDSRPITVAANLDVAESDLTPIDPQEIVAAVTGGARPEGTRAPAEHLTPEERERRQAFWWYLLLAGVLLLAIETILANRLSRGTAGGAGL